MAGLKLSRDQLAQFLKNHEQIRQFENLFTAVDGSTTDLEAVALEAADANAKANLIFGLQQLVEQALIEAGNASAGLNNCLAMINAMDDNLNAGAVTGAASQYVASGTYTPTLTNVTNVAASTARLCQWTRVGNVVTVSGQLDIDLTATLLASEVGMSLPIASALTTAYQLGGTANAVAFQANWAIQADAANDRAQFKSTGIVDVANDTYTFSFTYEVL